ncbi:MAG TPA: hypothetical protein VJG32_14315 [Anaerolineae bacterium]|nr:hypothetical protein [Anaerolineae bacterium]
MCSLLVTDFDGCLVAEDDKTAHAIHPTVAAMLKCIDRRAPVIIVTARASAKAVTAARTALRQAGLAHMPFLHRDMTLHDHSAEGIISAKVQAIEGYAAEHNLKPWAGIGDGLIDERVYQRLAMTIVRFAWRPDGAPDSAAQLLYAVDAERLPDVWRNVCADLLFILGRSNRNAGSDARRPAPEGD